MCFGKLSPSRVSIIMCGLLMSLISGCEQSDTSSQAGSNASQTSDSYIQTSKVIDQTEASCLKPSYKPYDVKYNSEIYDNSKPIVQEQEDPLVLKQLVYQARERLKQAHDRLDVMKSAEYDLYGAIESHALFTLAEMRTDSSAEILVDLLVDPSLSWDASRGLDIGNAITICGKLTLPYLKGKCNPKEKRYHSIKQLIELVERGEQMGI